MGSARIDLYSAERDVGVKLPSGTCGIMMSRSGLCINNSVTVFSGLIDQDYIGPINLVTFDNGNREFYVDRNMRLAQIE